MTSLLKLWPLLVVVMVVNAQQLTTVNTDNEQTTVTWSSPRECRPKDRMKKWWGNMNIKCPEGVSMDMSFCLRVRNATEKDEKDTDANGCAWCDEAYNCFMIVQVVNFLDAFDNTIQLNLTNEKTDRKTMEFLKKCVEGVNTEKQEIDLCIEDFQQIICCTKNNNNNDGRLALVKNLAPSSRCQKWGGFGNFRGWPQDNKTNWTQCSRLGDAHCYDVWYPETGMHERGCSDDLRNVVMLKKDNMTGANQGACLDIWTNGSPNEKIVKEAGKFACTYMARLNDSEHTKDPFVCCCKGTNEQEDARYCNNFIELPVYQCGAQYASKHSSEETTIQYAGPPKFGKDERLKCRDAHGWDPHKNLYAVDQMCTTEKYCVDFIVEADMGNFSIESQRVKHNADTYGLNDLCAEIRGCAWTTLVASSSHSLGNRRAFVCCCTANNEAPCNDDIVYPIHLRDCDLPEYPYYATYPSPPTKPKTTEFKTTAETTTSTPLMTTTYMTTDNATANMTTTSAASTALISQLNAMVTIVVALRIFF